MLAVLALCDGSAPAADVEAAKRAVAKPLKRLAALRDAQVQLKTVRMLRRVHPETDGLIAHLECIARRLAREARRRPSHARRAHKRLRRLEAELRRRCTRADEPAWRAGAIRALEHTGAAVRSTQPRASSGSDFHRARVALRAHRYAIEAVLPLLPSPAGARLATLHECQSIMGELHDLELLVSRVREFARTPACRRSLRPFTDALAALDAALLQDYARAAQRVFARDAGALTALQGAYRTLAAARDRRARK